MHVILGFNTLLCKIFESNDDIKNIYSNNFKYILVDEYQDTNFIKINGSI